MVYPGKKILWAKTVHFNNRGTQSYQGCRQYSYWDHNVKDKNIIFCASQNALLVRTQLLLMFGRIIFWRVVVSDSLTLKTVSDWCKPFNLLVYAYIMDSMYE